MQKPVPVYVIGAGYVGLVLAACLSRLGQCRVTCCDLDPVKVKQLQSGKPTIREHNLEMQMQLGMTSGRLKFVTDLPKLEPDAVVFIAVGTPSTETGAADLSYVMTAARTIAEQMTGRTTVVIKSTVPVGTARAVRREIRSNTNLAVAVVSNPEFLAEGQAVFDFLKPSRIVIGGDPGMDGFGLERLRQVYATFRADRVPFVMTSNESAELAKYACNAMLATRISFMNELARLCDAVGTADIEHIRDAMGLDSRIGTKFLRAGAGYGGSCFPKDVRAYCDSFIRNGLSSEIMTGVRLVNTRQTDFVYDLIRRAVGDVRGKRVAILGVAFKVGTDDTRESKSVQLIELLQAKGADVVAADPHAQVDNVPMAAGAREACTDADVAVLMTDWPEYVFMPPSLLSDVMRTKNMVDARNVLERRHYRDAGFRILSVGRPEAS